MSPGEGGLGVGGVKTNSCRAFRCILGYSVLKLEHSVGLNGIKKIMQISSE